MNWIKIKTPESGLHEIDLNTIVDFFYDTKQDAWVMVQSNRNGIIISNELHDKIIELMGNNIVDFTEYCEEENDNETKVVSLNEHD